MDRLIPLLIVGLVLGGLAGFMLAAGYGITLDGHDHDHAVMQHGEAVHAAHEGMLSLAADGEAPTLAMSLTPDPGTGWNLHVVTTNFRFSPRNVGAAHVAGEGHAHVYLDGVKLARLYAPWMHIADLPAGEHVVAVTLNANDHRALAIDGKPLRAETTITVD